jgi:hypothetical protein
MTRRALLSVAAVSVARAQDDRFQIFAAMAGALSQDSPREFLAPIDRAMTGYEALSRNIHALLDQATAGSAVEVIREEGGGDTYTFELDWFLEIKPKSAVGGLERRRERVTAKLERKGKRWRVTAMEPLTLFAPPKS